MEPLVQIVFALPAMNPTMCTMFLELGPLNFMITRMKGVKRGAVTRPLGVVKSILKRSLAFLALWWPQRNKDLRPATMGIIPLLVGW